MKNKRLARRYAHALGELAFEKDVLDEVEEELLALREILQSRSDFRRFFESQDVKEDQKRQMIHELFGDRLSRVTLNFLNVVVAKGRETYLEPMIEAYIAYANEKRGVVEVELTAAHPLTDEQAEAISTRLSQVTGKRVRLMTQEDKEILGGVVARIGDLVLDGSVKTRLSRLHDVLMRAELN